jgi:uncharacterized cupin superfamily protein
MTVIRSDAPGREFVKVGKDDGATRIWVCEADTAIVPKGEGAGLHHHGGDEIFHILSGTLRFHIDGRTMDVGAGHYVVVPPFKEHGFKVLTDDARFEFIGELEMGEWVTVLDSDGARREVEVRSDMVPWHRHPEDGEGTDLSEMFAMLQTTVHVLDVEPAAEDIHHSSEG